jgi:RNA polymerase subunit RPABC4/transcription elongation factor Spt4
MALKPCKECRREISSEAKACPHCGKKDPTGARTSPFAMGCLVIIILGVIGSLVSSNGTTGSSSSSTVPAQSPKEQTLSQVKLDYSWSKGGFDNVMLASFTITNPTSRPIKDVEITCTHFAASGTQIDENTRTIYQIVPAKGKKRIRDFNMGLIHSQASSSSCRISDLAVQ